MVSKNRERLTTLRYIGSQLKQFEIDQKVKPTDKDCHDILLKQVKLLKQAISQYEQSGRDDLAENETKQVKIIEEFLPKQLSETEIAGIIKNLVAKLAISSVKDLGKLMGAIKKDYSSTVDLTIAAKLAKDIIK
jgi:uncharacterized protein YqeY